MRLRIDTDRFEEILKTITRNRSRSLLTAFGIFWGIFMLLFLQGGAGGLRRMISANFDGFATNSAFIFTGETSEPYKGFKKGRRWELNITDVERLQQFVPQLDVVTPLLSSWGAQVTYREKKSDGAVKGLYPDYCRIESQDVRVGRFINDTDIQQKRKVCVLGSKVYEELFHDGEDAIGTYVKVGAIYYQVVGINYASYNGINIGGSAEESVIIPFTTMQQAYNRGDEADLICLTLQDGYSMGDVQPQIESLLKRNHSIHPDDKTAVTTLNAGALFGMVDTLFMGLDILLLMIGLGTLLAGAIGVSNIMMVTVRERTTEIGIRRAIGARPSDIVRQILSESMVLTVVAGALGISFAVVTLQLTESIASAAADMGTHIPFQITFGTAVAALLLLTLLGALAGLAPALRAMAVKPIDAIRDE